MDDSISFGEVEQTEPDPHRRPDQDGHLAVVSVGKVQADDLPVYVDIDTALDIESHVQENTEIELGGVLLGGQYLDDQGRPFVLIRDSLRAENYEATKSSFKFTHETWEKIARQRDQFPEGTEIVGWYHSHPGWGVFLSGMDMFICNGFFNGPLDVALVVDPCQQERGWFHWTQQDGQTVKRQTDGFYLFGSRFRKTELELTAAAMLTREDSSMVTSQRLPPTTGTAPVVHIHQPDQKWMGLAVLCVVLSQTVLVGLVAVTLLGGYRSSAPDRAYQSVVAKLLPDNVDEVEFQERFDRLVENQETVEDYEARLASMSIGVQQMNDNQEKLLTELEKERARNTALMKETTQFKSEVDELRSYKDATQKTIAEAEKADLIRWWSNWVNLAVVAVVLVGIFFGGMTTAAYFQGDRDDEDAFPASRSDDLLED